MKINVKVAETLLKKAVDKAAVTLNHAGMEVLSERINEHIGEPVFNQKYLYYNLFKEIEKKGSHEDAKIGLNTTYLHKLAQFIGFDDFFQFQMYFDQDKLDEEVPRSSANPNSLKVWCTKRKFKIWDIWRNPDQGILSLNDNHTLHFDGDQQIEISQIESLKKISMGGDGGSYWVRVSYQDRGSSQVLFLANASNPKPRLRLGSVGPLLKLLQKITL